MHAARNLNVISPLMEVGLTKEEIRTISREVYRLPTAEKPAMACLASRFPYGFAITKNRLDQVETVENWLTDHGFRGARARHHNETVRIELPVSHLKRVCSEDNRRLLVAATKAAGFTYVTVDLEGYRTGSMNEVLDDDVLRTG
jgi:uncharacterized protein